MGDYTLEYKQTSNSSTRGFYGAGTKPLGITIHHWGSKGQKHSSVVSWLRGTAGGTSNKGSSAHYVVSGKLVTQLEKDSRATWHAGNGKGNGTTIGIEMRPEMTDQDWDTLVQLCTDLEERHGSLKYYKHSDWKATACPGAYGPRIGELVKAVNAEHRRRKGGGSTKPSKPSKPATGSSSSSKQDYEVRKTLKANVPVRSRRNSKGDQVDEISSKGYRVNVVKDSGSWTQIRWKLNGKYGNYWVAKAHLDSGKASGGSTGSSKPSSKEWPYKLVPASDKHTTASHNAYVKMLAGVGFTDKKLTTAIQKWLQWNGYYKASDGFKVDGSMGKLTVQELQKFLKAKGFYKGVIDGDRGAMTVRAEIAYINSQAKSYK